MGILAIGGGFCRGSHHTPSRLPRKYRHQWLQYDPGNCVTHNLLWHRNVLEFWGGAYLSPKASGLFQQTELCAVPTMNGDSYKVQADMWNHTKHIHLKCLGSVLATVEQRSLDFWYFFCVSESLEHFLFLQTKDATSPNRINHQVDHRKHCC